MKYIRTKDGVYDLKLKQKYENDKETIEWFINHYYGGMTNLIKQADSIEELCDEFVTKVLHPNPHGSKPHGHYMDAMSFKDIVKYYLSSIEEKGKTYDVYGAIWTNKGLIYVAKMNDKGELELL